MRNVVKSLVVAGALVGASVVGVGVASAMPIAPDGGVQAPTAPIQPIVWPCGPGWHQNPWGRCVPFRPYWGGGYYYGGRYWGHPYWRGRYWGHPYWHRRYW